MRISAWRPSINDDRQWLQINLGKRFLLRGVATQGRKGMPYFVTEYHVRFSDDGASWSYYNDPLGMPEVINANMC